MRERRAGSLVLCALLVSVILPGPAAAATMFSTTVEQNVCVSGAGEYGFGHARLRVRIIEYGTSGANKFSYKAQVWVRRIHGTKWTLEYQWPLFTKTFPNNSDSYYNSRAYSYDPKRNVYFRIVVTVRAWHDSEVLYKKTVFGRIC